MIAVITGHLVVFMVYVGTTPLSGHVASLDLAVPCHVLGKASFSADPLVLILSDCSDRAHEIFYSTDGSTIARCVADYALDFFASKLCGRNLLRREC